MTPSQALLAVLLIFVGHSTTYHIVDYPVYARGNFSCDGKPLPGAEVTLQVVYNDTGHHPPPWIRVGHKIQPKFDRLPKQAPSKPHVDVVSLNSTATDGSGGYLLYAPDVAPGQWGVVTTLRLRIVHSCNVGRMIVLPREIVDIKVFSDDDLVGNIDGVPIYGYNADLAHRGDWRAGKEHTFD